MSFSGQCSGKRADGNLCRLRKRGRGRRSCVRTTGKNVADVSSRADGLSGNLQRERETLELIIGEYERTLNIQLWKNYADVFTVILQTPSGQEIIVQPDKNGRQDVLTNGTEVLVYAGQPSPYSVWQEIFLTCSHGIVILSPGSGPFI